MGGFSCASRCPAFLTFRDSPALVRQESDGYPVRPVASTPTPTAHSPSSFPPHLLQPRRADDLRVAVSHVSTARSMALARRLPRHPLNHSQSLTHDPELCSFAPSARAETPLRSPDEARSHPDRNVKATCVPFLSNFRLQVPSWIISPLAPSRPRRGRRSRSSPPTPRPSSPRLCSHQAW